MICSLSSIREKYFITYKLICEVHEQKFLLFEYMAVKSNVLDFLQWCIDGRHYDTLTSVDDISLNGDYESLFAGNLTRIPRYINALRKDFQCSKPTLLKSKEIHFFLHVTSI
jgi:hypothetical protein